MPSLLKNSFLVVLILLLATVTFSQAATAEKSAEALQQEEGLKAAQAKTVEEMKKIIATVNDVDITEEALQNIIRLYMPSMAFHQSVSPRKLRQIRAKSLKKIIDDEIFYAEAKVLKIKPDEKEIKASIKRLKKGLKKGTSLDVILENSGMTMEELKDDIRKTAMIALIKEHKETELKENVATLVTDEYMKDYYDKNQDKFIEPERLLVSEILVKADPGGGRKGWKKSLEKIQGIEKRIRGGEDFAVVAKEVSEDTYAKNGGDMGWAHKGSLSEALEIAISPLKIGEISKPVQSLYGYHLMKLNDKAPEVLKQYADLNLDRLRGQLSGSAYEDLWTKWFDEIKAKCTITVLDAKKNKEDKKN